MTPKIDIIIVDDENLPRQGLVNIFKNSEINVIDQAENGIILKQILKTKNPQIVLLDLEMPVLNGSKTLNALSKNFPQIKTIILSRYYDDELIKDMFNRGAKAYLSKNMDVKILFEAIYRVSQYGVFKDNIPYLLQNAAPKDRHYYKLIYSNTEIKLIHYLLQANKNYDEIANELCRSVKTVKNHAENIFKKSGVRTRLEFVEFGMKVGLIFIAGKDEL